MKIIAYIVAAALLTGAASCAKHEETAAGASRPAGEPVTVAVSLGAAGELNPDGTEIPATRTAPGVTVDEDSFKDLWVLQFAGTGGDAVLVAAPLYIGEEALAAAAGGPVELPLIHSGGAVHRLAFVANVHHSAFPWKLSPGVSTYDDLKETYVYLREEERSYNGANRTILMSGTVTAAIDGTSVGGVLLRRSLAKIELELKIDPVKAAGFSVRSLRMRSVPCRLDVCDALAERTGNYPDAHIFDAIDYEIIRNDDGSPLLTDGDDAGKFVWYVPRNARGTVEGLTPMTRNGGAPALATCFEIVAADASDNYVIYRIYPGADGTGDFNILPNRVYRYSLTIEGDGGPAPADSRISHYPGEVRFEGSSNSFLVNPPHADMPARRFSIPVKRVDQYWIPAYHGYGGIGGSPLTAPAGSSNPGKPLGWEISLLWQDAPDIVRPAASADPSRHITISKAAGSGASDFFSIDVPAGVRQGNFVLCLKCTDADRFVEGILWSWHFWVTDYAPGAEEITPAGVQLVYPVGGGQVERYVHSKFGYSADSSSNWETLRWNPEPSATAPYAESVMMDRNIGALVGGYFGNVRENGYFYQFGRKDPFAHTIPLYDIVGAALASAPSSGFPEQSWNGTNPNTIQAPGGSVNIIDAVRSPMLYFTKSAGDWSGLNENAYFWCDPQSPKQGSYLVKSIYDPCPEGWRMTTFAKSDFRHGATVNDGSRGLIYDDGIHYYPEIPVNGQKPVGGNIFYPVAGFRNMGSGNISYSNSGYYWEANPANVASGSHHYYSVKEVAVKSYHRAAACQIRCVSDNYKGN